MINVDATLGYARQALQRGDHTTAVALAQSAARMRLSTVFLADALAQICLELGLLNEAADVSRRAIALDPGQLRIWYRLGVVEAQRERLPEAREAFERVVALNPRSPAALSNLGSILQRMALPDLAIARYREALAIDPDHPESHSNLAASLAVLGRYDEALRPCAAGDCTQARLREPLCARGVRGSRSRPALGCTGLDRQNPCAGVAVDGCDGRQSRNPGALRGLRRCASALQRRDSDGARSRQRAQLPGDSPERAPSDRGGDRCIRSRRSSCDVRRSAGAKSKLPCSARPQNRRPPLD